MRKILGGMVAMFIGFIGLMAWWGDFLKILKGVIPIILVLGGVVAVYLRIEDIKTRSSTPPTEEKKDKV